MRDGDDRSGELFSYVDLEARVRRNHPLQARTGRRRSHSAPTRPTMRRTSLARGLIMWFQPSPRPLPVAGVSSKWIVYVDALIG
ncbi:MAG: hypothetical protein EOQ50_28035 [Mesorhizobium sp.]|nr:hypothetical protein EOA25_01010 [Mesorhizobium sp. M2A.F.Ca.ET.040.01.1.1]RWB68718.1 MAG: hypothetical protein EOQ50_28035 [Mesorhizobium sp.]